MSEPKNKKVLLPKLAANTTILVPLVIIAALGSFFSYKYFTEKRDKNDIQSLTKRLSKTIELPNEQPTAFTIADKSKLSNKTLSQRVNNGDTLLFFKSARRVLIYRSSTKKIVDILTIESSKAP